MRKQQLKVVPHITQRRDVDLQGDRSCAFKTQGDQSLPITAYTCPISVTGDDGSAPVTADMGQGDDWPGVGTGDEGGAQRDEFGRETVHRL